MNARLEREQVIRIDPRLHLPAVRERQDDFARCLNTAYVRASCCRDPERQGLNINLIGNAEGRNTPAPKLSGIVTAPPETVRPVIAFPSTIPATSVRPQGAIGQRSGYVGCRTCLRLRSRQSRFPQHHSNGGWPCA
jgi:hypothetical protein